MALCGALALVVVVIFAAPKVLRGQAPAASVSQTSSETPQENAPNSPAPVNAMPSAPEKKGSAPSVASTHPAASGSPNTEAVSNVVAAKASQPVRRRRPFFGRFCRRCQTEPERRSAAQFTWR